MGKIRRVDNDNDNNDDDDDDDDDDDEEDEEDNVERTMVGTENWGKTWRGAKGVKEEVRREIGGEEEEGEGGEGEGEGEGEEYRGK
uniref:Uncharacterized protein n=1 Tax=Vespula pensylvanica TaxID=30213 RepID=A0A834UH79_VESPE|nr:hypothetical protein H0235_001927 [Vespula pensylvanica]